MQDRGRLLTEQHNTQVAPLEELDTRTALAEFVRADSQAVQAVERAGAALALAVDRVAERLLRGGRLIYAGAGTSGRLALLDAAECPPTFQSPPEQVQAILAGGPAAVLRAVEGAEDGEEMGRQAVRDRELCERDALLGISAGGTTPFVHAALAEARTRGALTIFLACVPSSQVSAAVDIDVRLETGPELISGSTRLKAGTATKLALNALSTLVMVRLGKTYKNRMVDVETRTNQKLIDRGERLVMELVPCERAEAREWLAAAEGGVKLAIVMARLALSRAAAQERLRQAGGRLGEALNSH